MFRLSNTLLIVADKKQSSPIAYLLLSVWFRADPGVQTNSPQVTFEVISLQ